jgi:NAD(P)-dependent dehydrogenase (short-subunit alcohol dehydrogenase family)
VINCNLKGTFLTGQAAARQMVSQGTGGAIINMGSVNGVTAIPTIASYNASKGGIHNLTKSMALSLSKHNIRVNAVGPGSIMTDMLKKVAHNKEVMAEVLSRTPMLRAGDPIEVGNVVKFLASEDSSYITGQTLYVDGGRLALNYTVPVPEEALEAATKM